DIWRADLMLQFFPRPPYDLGERVGLQTPTHDTAYSEGCPARIDMGVNGMFARHDATIRCPDEQTTTADIRERKGPQVHRTLHDQTSESVAIGLGGLSWVWAIQMFARLQIGFIRSSSEPKGHLPLPVFLRVSIQPAALSVLVVLWQCDLVKFRRQRKLL